MLTMGTKVTILEGGRRYSSGGFEKQMTALLRKDLKKQGAEIVTKASSKRRGRNRKWCNSYI